MSSIRTACKHQDPRLSRFERMTDAERFQPHHRISSTFGLSSDSLSRVLYPAPSSLNICMQPRPQSAKPCVTCPSYNPPRAVPCLLSPKFQPRSIIPPFQSFNPLHVLRHRAKSRESSEERSIANPNTCKSRKERRDDSRLRVGCTQD
jgi:hypothetical protein